MVVHISVYIGHLCQGFSHKTPLATSVTERWYIAPGVKRVNVSEKEVRGTLFIPPGTHILNNIFYIHCSRSILHLLIFSGV